MADSEFSYEELLEYAKKADAGDHHAMINFILCSSVFANDPEMDAADDKVSEYITELENTRDTYAFLALGDAFLNNKAKMIKVSDNEQKLEEYKSVRKDLQKAYEFYEKAIEIAKEPCDATPAYAILGDAFYFGRGKEKNYKESFVKYKNAAAYSTHGEYMLAESYRLGRGTNKNLKLALKYYQICTHLKECDKCQREPFSEIACYRTAKAYHYGWGTDVNMELAQKYIDAIASIIDEHHTYRSVTKEDLQAEYDAIYKDLQLEQNNKRS